MFNKIAMAVLATLLVLQTIRIVAEDVLFPEEHAATETAEPQVATPAAEPAPAEQAAAPAPAAPEPAAPAEQQAAAPAAPAAEQVAQAPAESPAAPAAPAGEPDASPALALIAAADPGRGRSVNARCIGCHTFNEGEANRVGPNLYNVVGAPIGHVEGFDYSDAFDALNAAGATWTYAELDAFLRNPAQHIPGNKMTFPGIPNDSDRAASIAYLRTLSANPLPLPGADAAAAPAPAEPAPAESPGGAMAGPPAQDQAMAGPPPQDQAMAGPPAESPAAPAAPAEPQAVPAEPQVAQAPAEPAAPAAEASPAIAMIATADVAKGRTVTRRCVGCHTFEKGEPNRVGPNLYGVIGAPIGHIEGYDYSDAFDALNAAGATWTYAEMDAFLRNPAQHIPGNKMSFPGIANDADRAAAIAYLRAQADTPEPLP